MGYPTKSTQWPRPDLPSEIKQLVDRFFILADSKSDDAGEVFAREIFTESGIFILAHETFEGADEICNARRDAWAIVKSRRHEILKVYANDVDGIDLLIIGLLDIEYADGKHSRREFVSRMEIDQTDAAPRIQQYRILDPAPQDPRSILGKHGK